MRVARWGGPQTQRAYTPPPLCARRSFWRAHADALRRWDNRDGSWFEARGSWDQLSSAQQVRPCALLSRPSVACPPSDCLGLRRQLAANTLQLYRVDFEEEDLLQKTRRRVHVRAGDSLPRSN